MFMGGTTVNPLITLTLARGGSENSLAASGTYCSPYSHSETTYTVTGKFGTPEEDGRTPMGLTFIHPPPYLDTELEGKFDPEEKSLRGTFKYYSGMFTGDFVFKRIPDFLRFYPPPATTTALKRWRFATMVVLDKIQRDSCSPTHLLQRVKDGRRYMELSIRARHYGKVLDTYDEAEYSKLFTTLAGDAQFFASLIPPRLAGVVIQ